MLPGFRFLFAAIVLSMSILVFGFGAAALLRTAHEEFANTPTWQPAPETRFAQSREASQSASPPVLAMLRVDDTPKDASNDAPKIDQPASDNAPATATADQAAAIAAEPQPALEKSEPEKSEPEKIAALQPAAASPPEAAQPEARLPEAPVAEPPPQAETAADAPAATDATKIAGTEQPSPPTSEAAPAASVEIAPAAPEQASAPADINNISTRIATLGGPPVTIDQRPAKAKAAGAKPDSGAVKKHQRSQREVRRRRIAAARARLAKQAAQPLDAFGQPTTATATR
jgi:hypothetical protein